MPGKIKIRRSKLNFHISVYKQVCAYPFILVHLFSDVKKSGFVFQDTNSGSMTGLPKKLKRKHSILKSELFDGTETGHG